MENLITNINQLDLPDYTTLVLKMREYKLFSGINGIFSWIDHMPYNETSVKDFEKGLKF